MEMEIDQNGTRRTVQLKNPKGREVKKALKMLLTAQNLEEEKEQISRIDQYMDYVEEIASKNSGMTIDELDDLDIDEKNKVVQYYANKISGSLDFLKSSLMRQN